MSIAQVVPNDDEMGKGGVNIADARVSASSRIRAQGSIIHTQISKTITQISKAIKRNKALLAKAELYGMAFLSISDMASDIVMSVRYYQSDKLSYALGTLVCVLINLVVQSFQTFASHPLGSQVKEQIIVWSLLKPAVDAHRVASKADAEKGARIEVLAEMSGARVIELVAESIPGTIIQAMAMFSVNGDSSFTPVLSLSSSILTSAFISAQLSYEWDASEQQRVEEPVFYGYLPKSLKWSAFALFNLLLISIFNLILRTSALVILSQKSAYTTMAVFGGELALFFVVKIARGDFTSWVPIAGCPGVIASFTMRLFIKVAVDWTACAQFRHQQEGETHRGSMP